MILKHGFLFLDEQRATPKINKDAVLEDFYSHHPGSFVVLSLAKNLRWPNVHRNIIANASEKALREKLSRIPYELKTSNST